MARLFVLCICVLAVALSFGKECKNVRTGLNKLRLGVDATKLDWLPFDQSKDDGFRLAIIDFTCNGTDLDEDGFETPYQINNMNPNPTGSLSSSVDIYKSSNSYQNTMSAKAGIDVAGGLFSASTSYNKIEESITKSENYVEEVQVHITSFNAQLREEWVMEVSSGAKHYIDNYLPSKIKEGNVEKFMTFIEKYGTHFIQKGKFGGTLRFLIETDQSYFKDHDEDTVRAEAKGLIKSVTLSASTEVGSSSTDETFEESSRTTVSYFGGETNLMSDGYGLSKWQPTVYNNPILFAGTLEPIYKLMKNSKKKKAMEKAYQIYLTKAHLAAIKKRINLMKSAVDLLKWNPAANKTIIIPLYNQMMDKMKPLESKVMLLPADVNRLAQETKTDIGTRCYDHFYINYGEMSEDIKKVTFHPQVENCKKGISKLIFGNEDI